MERAARREQVLSCAVRVFSHKGYHATTVSDIIAEAGVARGTFYLYFKSKRAIFDELLERFLEQIMSKMKRVELSPEAPSPLVRDTERGWRTGRLDRVLGGHFDLIQA